MHATQVVRAQVEPGERRTELEKKDGTPIPAALLGLDGDSANDSDL
jgi:hypothetical protein